MLFVQLLVIELVTFNSSIGFNVTAPGQKVTVYASTVGWDVTRNKATGVKSHIIDIDNNINNELLFCPLQPFIVNYILLYCQVWTETYFSSTIIYGLTTPNASPIKTHV